MLGKSGLKILIPLAMTALLVLAGCGQAAAQATTPAATEPGGATTPPVSTWLGVSVSDGTRYRPTWITPAVAGQQVTLDPQTIEQGKMAHFWVNVPAGKEGFMAYRLDGVTYVRASICVPCRSYNFSLQKGQLVCDTCGSKFDAKTGIGISGACVSYPKSPVKFQLAAGNLVFTLNDLASAYANTLQPG